MCLMQMVVTKKEKYKDANSNNNSDKVDQDHIAIFMEEVEEIAREKGVYTNNVEIVIKNTQTWPSGRNYHK